MDTIKHAQVLITIAILLVILQVNRVSSCKCLSGVHIQNFICQNDFVIKGLVIDRDPYELKRNDGVMDRTREYRVKVETLYKDSDSGIADTLTISTNFESASCGVIMEVNETYIIAGTLTAEGAEIHSCSSLRDRFSSISVSQLEYLRDNTYEQNCDCQVENCRQSQCPSCSTPGCERDFCTAKYETDTARLMNENAYCTRTQGQCEWEIDSSSAFRTNSRWTFVLSSVIGAIIISFMNKFDTFYMHINIYISITVLTFI